MQAFSHGRLKSLHHNFGDIYLKKVRSPGDLILADFLPTPTEKWQQYNSLCRISYKWIGLMSTLSKFYLAGYKLSKIKFFFRSILEGFYGDTVVILLLLNFFQDHFPFWIQQSPLHPTVSLSIIVTRCTIKKTKQL